MSKPIAVLISDVHYDLNTLQFADAAMRQAITKANYLKIPLIVAGDLHNTKANMRAECVNAMRETLKLCEYQPAVIVGNHCRINEKSKEHALNFLRPYADVYDEVGVFAESYIVPYHSDLGELRTYLRALPKGSRLIMHQGLIGTNSGEYIQDKSAIIKDDVAGFRVISGHYHTRQTIELPDGGKWDYIGNPYTLNFGEANDPIKGFHILYDDGSLEFVPTNLRRHMVIEMSADSLDSNTGWVGILPDDLVWAKVSGTKEQLSRITKDKVHKKIIAFRGHLKLDLIPTDNQIKVENYKQVSNEQLLDTVITGLDASEEYKIRIKQLWRDLSES